jgi:mono/diheme cytochrome c family protein
MSGRALVQAHCAACHAVGSRGASPNREAPPLRTLGQRYPIENLEEALAEGILVGHPAVPQFQFGAEEVESLVAYLRSIQTPAKRSQPR